MNSYFSAIWVLHSREWLRFLRSPGRILGAIGAPLMFWAVLGSGMGSSFIGREGGAGSMAIAPGTEYLVYFFPGMLALVILFTSIFAAISIIEDRHEGFLQMVMVSRVPRSAVVLGKVAGWSTLASAQAVVMLPLLFLLGAMPTVAGLIASVGAIFLISTTLSALGFLCAWKFDSVQSFHSVMNLLLFPMWLLSGAVFPAEGALLGLKWAIALNPLSYGVLALRHALFDSATLLASPGGFLIAQLVLFGFSLAFLSAATWLVVNTGASKS